MAGRVPAIFVSSTFFDLRQVRADLADCIEKQLGYRALISEQASFPIDPDASTVENCRRRVEQDADILVLIIGSRYGSIDPDAQKSVTNIEYLTARAKAVPVYAFVEKRTLTLYEVWQKSGKVAVEGLVDDVALFVFIDQLRSADKVWMNSFETAQDICAGLRAQLAYLMTDGLSLRARMNGQALDRELSSLSGAAFRIAVEKPKAWEHRLFCRVLIDEVNANFVARREHRAGIVFGAGDFIPAAVVMDWVQSRLQELNRLVSGLTTVMNTELQEAFGPIGQPGDARSIVIAARQITTGYRTAIDWAQSLRRAHVPENFQGVVLALAAFTDDVISKIEAFGPECLRQILEALALPPGDEPRVIRMTLDINLSNLEKFEEEMDRLREGLGV